MKFKVQTLLEATKLEPLVIKHDFCEKNGFNDEGEGWIVLGNTYDIKDQLKAEGARYNGNIKHWILPADNSKYTTYKVYANDLFEINPKSGIWDYRWPKDPTSLINELSKLEKAESSDKSDIKEAPAVDIGSRITINIKSADLKTTGEGSYGTYYLYEFLDADNNQYIWYAHKEIDLSDIETVTGTVTGFKEYKGVRQVVLSRCKINVETTKAKSKKVIGPTYELKPPYDDTTEPKDTKDKKPNYFKVDLDFFNED